MKRNPSANELARQIERHFELIRSFQEEIEMSEGVHHEKVKRLWKNIRESQKEILKKQKIINKLNK